MAAWKIKFVQASQAQEALEKKLEETVAELTAEKAKRVAAEEKAKRLMAYREQIEHISKGMAEEEGETPAVCWFARRDEYVELYRNQTSK